MLELKRGTIDFGRSRGTSDFDNQNNFGDTSSHNLLQNNADFSFLMNATPKESSEGNLDKVWPNNELEND